MTLRFPKVPFEASGWRLHTLHGAESRDFLLAPALTDFAGRDASFTEALRCIAAELALGEQAKSWECYIGAFRLLHKARAPTLFDLSLRDLRQIESGEAERARANPSSAAAAWAQLVRLGRYIDLLSVKGVIQHIRYTPSRDLRAELQRQTRAHRQRWKQEKTSLLDRQIEALCLAMNALFNNDRRLSEIDRVAIAMLGLQMCAPSRVNEILCLGVDDRVTLDDYTKPSEGQQFDKLHAAHQQLIVTMKGSKGAQWGAKPVLNFMIDLFNHCLDVIIRHGERSRMLATWYERNPDTLYLSRELEYLRGRDVSRSDMAKIIRMSPVVSEAQYPLQTIHHIAQFVGDKQFMAPNPNTDSLGRRGKQIKMIPWANFETYMVKSVQKAMAECRRVTGRNFYKGDISKMVFLFDRNEMAYLPFSLKYLALRGRLKQSDTSKRRYMEREGAPPEPTLFEKLGITMPVDGQIQFAYIESHDPRRWLTTQAMLHREKLPDVLINLWANRISLAQLQSYDLRTAEQKAHIAAMPNVVELNDLSAGIEAMHKIEESYGLRTEIVTVHDAGINVTSMDAIAAAVDNRPVAKTSEQLFIIYPSWFGACMHQHHETPCRSYGSCLPCDNNLVVKGHLSTNDRIKERKDVLHRSIVEQLDKLLIAQNRGIPDHPEGLSAHVLMLVGRGIDPEQMADELIDRFHEIKHLIKDVCFATKLEEAFVAKGFVKLLDDPNVASGALIKYHNPTRHAAPGLERALDAHGGRVQIDRDRDDLIRLYPEFAPTSQGLNDQRSLSALEDDDEAASDESGSNGDSESGDSDE